MNFILLYIFISSSSSLNGKDTALRYTMTFTNKEQKEKGNPETIISPRLTRINTLAEMNYNPNNATNGNGRNSPNLQNSPSTPLSPGIPSVNHGNTSSVCYYSYLISLL